MKVLALNSSPGGSKGNTALILKPFLEGMKNENADVTYYDLKDLNINMCRACVSCWFRTPEVCSQSDDMKWLLPKIKEADILVLASPTYTDAVSAKMKILMERMLPLVHPQSEKREGLFRHILREDHNKNAKIVLVASCGHYENLTFDPMVKHIQAFSGTLGRQYAGALLRTQSLLLQRVDSVDDIYKAAKDAGHQLIKTGEMLSETLETISRDLMPLDEYISISNSLILKKSSEHLN